ncbi:MAG TPA: TetR/AcrR family transcriptional regulator [Acidimicrobiales bacterium]|nr:TetR/AcrR family transcriptional regulator [Acidimicrobiales bacterium]
MTRNSADTRARILCAAEDLVIRDGVSKLTLEAAAHEAGVSKGGILYHFPSRAALVSAMVERYVVSFDAALEELDAFSGRPGDFTRAYLEATLAEPPGDQREQRLGGALLAGVASDPELLAPLRERFAAWQASLEDDGLAPELSTVVRLAADGIWLSDLFGLAPLGTELRAEVGRRLARMIDEAAGAGGAPRAATGRDDTADRRREHEGR